MGSRGAFESVELENFMFKKGVLFEMKKMNTKKVAKVVIPLLIALISVFGISKYVGEWNPSGGHWFGLDFMYRGK